MARIYGKGTFQNFCGRAQGWHKVWLMKKCENTVGSSDKVKPSPSGEGAGQTKKLRIAICRFLV